MNCGCLAATSNAAPKHGVNQVSYSSLREIFHLTFSPPTLNPRTCKYSFNLAIFHLEISSSSLIFPILGTFGQPGS